MHEALTQKDIDAVVGGPQIASAVTEGVRTWDFTVPRRLPKAQRAVLETIHVALAVALQGALGARLRGDVALAVRSIERTAFGDVVMSLDSPCVACTFTPGGALPGIAMLDLSAALAYHVVDRLFGGTGEGRPPTRPLTALEQTIARQVAMAALDAMREAWAPVAALAPEMVALDQDAELVKIAGLSDDVLAVVFEARSGAFRGWITLAVPMAAVETALAARGATAAHPVSRPAAVADAHIVHGLRQARVELTARLPEIRVAAREIASFAPGQVFRTGLPRDTSVEVSVNGSLRFAATLGQLRRRLGLRITENIDRSSANAAGSMLEGRSK